MRPTQYQGRTRPMQYTQSSVPHTPPKQCVQTHVKSTCAHHKNSRIVFSKKIPLILRNRRDFCVPSVNAVLSCEVHIILFAPAWDPSSQSSDTLMSRQRIYAPLRVSVFGVRFGPVGVAVDVRWFSMCAPCLANYGGGGCRLLVCCLVVGCFACRAVAF